MQDGLANRTISRTVFIRTANYFASLVLISMKGINVAESKRLSRTILPLFPLPPPRLLRGLWAECDSTDESWSHFGPGKHSSGLPPTPRGRCTSSRISAGFSCDHPASKQGRADRNSDSFGNCSSKRVRASQSYFDLLSLLFALTLFGFVYWTR